MRIHILGICGTFMAGIATIAKQLGHTVTGCDEHVYPPMSTYLENIGIEIIQGFDSVQFKSKPDCVIIGNALSRGNPAVESVLAQRVVYLSGPQWLAQEVLQHRWVLAVAGTHGKTTTTSILTWILTAADLSPGYLIGGIANNFPTSAELGRDPFFVIEADEYDTAFFDKQSKFLHYRPQTVILNNLEFDHADIFPDLAAIQRQFHLLVRTIPNTGLIIRPTNDLALDAVLAQGCWTPIHRCGFKQGDWQVDQMTTDGSEFEVIYQGERQGRVRWQMIGQHNVSNALTAVAAARHAGVPVSQSIAALSDFQGIKRRLEIRGVVNGVTVYDDFAHHPTAIAATLQALRDKVRKQRIIAVLEFASNTMKAGVHGDQVGQALQLADEIFVLQTGDQNNSSPTSHVFAKLLQTAADVDSLVSSISRITVAGDHVLIMSNKSFAGIHEKLLMSLARVDIVS